MHSAAQLEIGLVEFGFLLPVALSGGTRLRFRVKVFVAFLFRRLSSKEKEQQQQKEELVAIAAWRQFWPQTRCEFKAFCGKLWSNLPGRESRHNNNLATPTLMLKGWRGGKGVDKLHESFKHISYLAS